MGNSKEHYTSEHNKISESLWFKLLKVPHLIHRHGIHFFQEHNLTPPQFFVCRKVYEGEILTQQALANKRGVSKGNISQMLKLMERDGFIKREAEGTAKQITLTQKALTMLEEVIPAHIEFTSERLAGLTHDEQKQLLSLLSKLENSLC